MKKTLAVLALGVLAASTASAAVAAPPSTDPPIGRKCSFNSQTDPTPEAPADTQTGQINVGPILSSGVVKCTIQVGGAGVHSDPDSTAFITATDNTIPGVIIGAGVVSYVSPDQVPVYLCTQITVGGVTKYWDGENGVWSTSASVECGAATSIDTTDPAVRSWIEGTVDITPCGVTVCASYSGFSGMSPSDCALDPVDAVVTCAPVGGRCYSVTVTTTGVSGETACSNGGATSPGTGEYHPAGPAPWTCAAHPGSQLLGWSVECTVRRSAGHDVEHA